MEAEIKRKSEKKYKYKAFIQKDYIVLEIETDSEKYSTFLFLDKLQKEYKYFKQAENIEEALDYLKDLLKENCIVEEKEEKIYYTIKFKKYDINFILDKVKEGENILYNSLYDGMKKIIDNNRLVLGIDLGTTYSSAAVMIDKNIVMIRNSLGSTTTPSYISFLSKNEVYVGELAKLLPSDAKNIIFNTKRLLGKNLEDKEIKEMKTKLPFTLIKDEKLNSLKIELNFGEGKKNKEEFYPEQICALILKKIVHDSEFYIRNKIGKDIKIEDVVITVPAYFNQKQREATINSAKILGLNVIAMINEPTAASLAYAYKSLENTEKKIIVIDFGGGTLDLTLLNYRKNKDGIYCDVKFTYGNTNFGGEDFDNILADKCLAQCIDNLDNETNVSNEHVRENKFHYLRMKRACERAKIKLSSFDSANIYIQNDNFENIDFSITRNEFIEYCKEEFNKFEKILDDFIHESKINIKDITEIILTGGSTLIPKIRDIISKKFSSSEIKNDLDPKEVVAMGAAIRGAKFCGLSSVKDIKLFDVTNLSLGVKLKDNLFEKLIPRSTPIPCFKMDTFETVQDNQDFAIIEIYEGEEEKNCDKNNLFLGTFKISGLPKSKKGETKIKVKLEIKENLILEVTAIDNSNEENQNKLIIEKLNDFPSIIEKIKKRQNCINFFENQNYNKIKFLIMEFEDKIRKEKTGKKIDMKSIKSAYKTIIELIGEIIIKYDDVFSNIYISFIKFYFNKICEFFLIYNQDNKDDFEKIKQIIINIFEKIQINKRDVIFEIIEESIDEDNIYKNFIDFIMQFLWEDINSIYLLSNSVVRENNKKKYNEELNNLSKAKSLIEVCIKLINKFDKNKEKLNNILKSDLEEIKLKIEVREIVIKIKNKNFLGKIFTNDKKHAKELYNKYIDCPNLDIDDLNELADFLKDDLNESALTETNLNKEIQKATMFINWINEKNENDDYIMTIHKILTDYPYGKTNSEKEAMWKDFTKLKEGKSDLDDYLLKIKGNYEIEQISDIESPVYTAIKEYFNKF